MGADRGETSFVISYINQYLMTGQNAFVEKLGSFGFNAFRMLVVDFMHECELGTWKSLFTHLIRLLYALPAGDSLVACLDSRYMHCHLPFPKMKLMVSNLGFVKFRHMATALFADLRTTRRK
jgi:hypothetical protein